MYKKLLVSLFLFVSLLLVTTPLVHAVAPDQQPKNVKGKIKKSNGDAAAGASVAVSCGTTTLNTTTADNGKFDVTFANGACVNGDTITVVASLDGNNGSESVAATNNKNYNLNDITLAVSAVPEFNTVTGSIAFIGSLSAFYLFRRKKFATVNAS